MLGPLVVLLCLMFATYAGIRAASAADRRAACRCGRALDVPDSERVAIERQISQ